MRVVRLLPIFGIGVAMLTGMPDKSAANPLPPTMVQVDAGNLAQGVTVANTYSTLRLGYNALNGGTHEAASAGAPLGITRVAATGNGYGSVAGLSFAEAYIQYSFEISGPDGTVPILVIGNGGIQVSGDATSQNAGAAIIIGGLGGACAGLARDYCHAGDHSSFDITGIYSVLANQEYGVLVDAVVLYGGGSSWTATAFADPSFAIDPTFARAGEYTLIFSPGLESIAVPEPPALPLFGFAALGIAGVKLRRRFPAAEKPDRSQPYSPDEQPVDVRRATRSWRTLEQRLIGRNLPFRLPVRDSL
ncbi:MAG: hypothetical protein J0H14_17100 [Alphaproteobacteria bacterium]|nr:hypothetical protein [Alphaproteobacteria bacterium]